MPRGWGTDSGANMLEEQARGHVFRCPIPTQKSAVAAHSEPEHWGSWRQVNPRALLAIRHSSKCWAQQRYPVSKEYEHGDAVGEQHWPQPQPPQVQTWMSTQTCLYRHKANLWPPHMSAQVSIPTHQCAASRIHYTQKRKEGKDRQTDVAGGGQCPKNHIQEIHTYKTTNKGARQKGGEMAQPAL